MEQEQEQEVNNSKKNMAMKEALRNNLILREIMSLCDNWTLLTCRLVCKNWMETSSHVLRTEDRLRVTIDRQIPSESHQMSLREFNRVVKNSISFPTKSFNFDGYWNFDNLQVCQFFLVNGANITSLELSLTCDDEPPTNVTINERMSIKRFFEILTRDAPNIEKLIFNNYHFFQIDSHQIPKDKLSLPSLKYFSWLKSPHSTTQSFPVIRKVLQSAPNLRTIKNFPGEQINILTKAQMMMIEKVDFSNSNLDPNDLTKFIQTDTIRLKRISIVLNENQLLNHLVDSAYSRLLEMCNQSLEDLSLSPSMFQIQFPKLVRLKILRVVSYKLWRSQADTVSFRNLDLSQVFPNVESLDCTKLTNQSHFHWLTHTPATLIQNRLRSVQSLYLRDECIPYYTQGLYELCPNFRNLILTTSNINSFNFNQIIRAWPFLEKIQLNVEQVVRGRVNLKILQNLKGFKSLEIWFQRPFHPVFVPKGLMSGIQNLSSGTRVNIFFDHQAYLNKELKQIESLLCPWGVKLKHKSGPHGRRSRKTCEYFKKWVGDDVHHKEECEGGYDCDCHKLSSDGRPLGLLFCCSVLLGIPLFCKQYPFPH